MVTYFLFKFANMAATIKAPAIFTAKDRVSPTMAKMSRSVKGFSNRASVGIARVEHRFNRLMTPINRVGRMLGDFGILAGGFLAYQVFNDITNFETGMVGVSKTTGIVGEDLDKLTKDFINLSDEMRGVSAQSLVEVGQTAGQLGVTGSEDILKFSRVMAQLETATDVAGEEGASNIARLLTLTGEGVGVIDQFGSALTGLGNSSAATEAEILSVASEVARGTSAYKLQSKEVLGLSATLKSLGMRPEGAGTAVAKTFRTIEMATLNGGQELENFADIMGKTSAQVVEDFEKNPKVAFDNFIKGLNRIDNEGGSVAKTMQKVGLRGEGVAKTIIPLAGNFDLLSKNQALSSKEFEKNTALQNEFDSATKTVAVGLKDVQKSFTNLTLKTATAGSGLEKLQNILFWVSDNMQTIVVVGATLAGTMIAMKTAIVLSKIALAAYNVALGINTAITQSNKRALIGNVVAQGVYKVAMGVSTAVTWLATTAFASLAISVLAAVWPILAVIAAVIAIIAIFKNWDAIVEWFGKKWNQFTSLISAAWETTVNFFKEFSFEDFFMSIGASILKFMLLPLKGALKLIDMIPGKKIEFVQSGLNFIDSLEKGIDSSMGQEDKVLPNTNQASNQQTNESIRDSRVNIDVRDKGNNVERVEQDGNEVPIMMRNTAGAF